MSSEDTEIHMTEELIHTLLNPTPTTPLMILGNKQNTELKHIEYTFNMSIPTQETPPDTTAPPQEESPVSVTRAVILEATLEALP